MKIQKLDNQFSVSEQISADDVSTLAADGVQVLVCNRPDGEAVDQPNFSTIRAAAETQGLEAVNIAFTAGQMSESHVNQLARVIESGKRIHAYCRSGTRSENLWQAASERGAGATAKAPGDRYDVVVVGAGAGGIAVAASLLKRTPKTRIALIDPAEYHYYQPGWTMVGGGVFDVQTTRRRMASLIPEKTDWIKEAVQTFVPEQNAVQLGDGRLIYYNHLVVAAGIKLNWEAVEGLTETLGKNGVTSNYSYDLAPYTWELVTNFKGGRALFTQPPMPIKCAGAPQKALYLSADHWRRTGVLDDVDLNFYNAGGVLFGVPEYVPALKSYMERYGACLHFNHNLKRIDGQARKAWFSRKSADGIEEMVETDFDMIHVCPPQCAPDFIRQSPLVDEAGWVDVDPATLRHKRLPNVWGLGDVTNTSNAKTMAAVRKQAPVVAQNLSAVMDGKEPVAEYDGYGSCPLTVERGKIVLAEFTYGGKLAPTFPKWLNDGTRPTRLAWELKARVLPPLYWHAMLKGHEWLTSPAH
ncbi:beta-lactamase hydrolase domain-containing protein [Gilvimarinus sp. F26214L]|uniref:beta-lactamase hydrolase domain-containing protein n=1 Tax=Gilvimarinus sp. DZF01 TaxID=3461371 RepID=UPI00404617A8